MADDGQNKIRAGLVWVKSSDAERRLRQAYRMLLVLGAASFEDSPESDTGLPEDKAS